MTYIIQNRIVQILYNDRDFNDQLKRMLFSEPEGRASKTNHRNTIINGYIWSK